MVTRAARDRGLSGTRELILTTAERLFAEHGVFSVSNRQVSGAAGQGNNAAVGYHFGSKADLVRAIVRHHGADLERRRASMLAATEGSAAVRDWVACLVRPLTDHLASSAGPTWFARFGAQVMTDPALRTYMAEESLGSPVMRRIVDGLSACLPDLPRPVREERDDMTRHLLVHVCAERERAVAKGAATPRATWDDAATGLIDAITALWQAPAT